MGSVPVPIWPSGRCAGSGAAACLYYRMDGRRCNRHAIAMYRHSTVPRCNRTEDNIKLRPIEVPVQMLGIVSGALMLWEYLHSRWRRSRCPYPQLQVDIGARVLTGAIFFRTSMSRSVSLCTPSSTKRVFYSAKRQNPGQETKSSIDNCLLVISTQTTESCRILWASHALLAAERMAHVWMD